MSRLDLSHEHRLLHSLDRVEGLHRGRWLVAVSGGLDSMVLAEMLWRWRKRLGVELIVAYVHHGQMPSEQGEYRSKAQLHVRQWCRLHRVKFISNRPQALSCRSEAELREFRYRALRRWQRELGASTLVLAHHRDDLIETRLLRLIRGSGPRGLDAMRLLRGKVLRPLLSFSRAELEAYASFVKLKWCEDPSNEEVDSALRNWMRGEWLPQLERRQKGALKALARSLELLTQEEKRAAPTAFVGLRRKDLSRATHLQREAAIAEYLHGLGLQGYGRTHVEEIAKRLLSRRKTFSFAVLGVNFRVTPDLVWASRV